MSFTAKALFGLGITRSKDFITLLHKYKATRSLIVSYINAASMKYNSKADIVVFDSVRELFRTHRYVKPHQILVVSEVPTLLKEISECVPLDFDNQRSFEFNFKPIDIQIVLRALRNKKQVKCDFTGYNNLGYHIERVSNSGDFIGAFVALNANLEHLKRNQIRIALDKFFTSKKTNPTLVTKVVDTITEGMDIDEAVERFNTLFTEQADSYHKAINSDLPSAVAAKKHNVDAYAISFMKRLIRSVRLTDERLARNKQSSGDHVGFTPA